MESVKRIEKTFEGYYKTAHLPHLPKGLVQFFATWAWLFTLIGVVLGVLGILMAILAVFAAQALIGVAGVYAGQEYASQVSASLWATTAISIVFTVIIIAIQTQAISPLKEKKIKGWDLIFLASLVGLLSSVVQMIVSAFYDGAAFSIFSAVIGLFITAVVYVVVFYILFEVKPYFHGASPKKVSSHKK